jgi:aryl-alcohol dehydrogenase-like predicted oxidoreductase
VIERRRFGRTDMDVSVLGWGGAEVGYQDATPGTVERLLGAALDAGLDVIDTAECYGESEALIGAAVAHRRDDYYLFTKCGHASGLPGADWEPRMLAVSIDRSLARLRTERVDLLQLHSCDEATLRQGDVVDVLRRAREQGKARYLGYSGDGAAALYAVRSGAFDALQISVNIADQEAIDRVLPEAAARGMGVVAKRPIANAAWRTGRKPESSYHHAYWDRLEALRYDFLTRELTESVATALRFTLSTPGVHTAIVGSANPDRWRANAALAARGPMPRAEYEAIRARWQAVAPPDWTGQA